MDGKSLRIYKHFDSMHADLGSTQKVGPQNSNGSLGEQGTSSVRSSSTALTLNLLRHELKVALDQHADRLMTRIHQDVIPLKDVECILKDPGFADVCLERRPSHDSSHASMDSNDDLLHSNSNTRQPHRWTLRNTYAKPGAPEGVLDTPAKRSFKTYRFSERSTARLTTPATRARPLLDGEHDPTQKGSRHSEDSGRMHSTRMYTPLEPQGGGFREDEEEPAEEALGNVQARVAKVSQATDYFEDQVEPATVNDCCCRCPLFAGHFHRWLKNVVESSLFEYACGLFVILNAASLGMEINFQVTHEEVTHHSEHLPWMFGTIEAVFCALFTLEQVMRLCVYGGHFFTMKGCQWNIFDLVVVSLQLLTQISHVIAVMRVNVDLSAVRMFRILRLVRITRLIRVLRMVHELRTLVASIIGSFKSLGWTLLLLMIVIYTFSVVFTQIVLDCLPYHPVHAAALEQWFGSLARTALTLFESILGGVSWEEVVLPISEDISPTVVALFCFYVAFCVFALMNVVTGEFVEKAMQTAQDHKDMYFANRISETFFTNEGDHITWEVFARKMDDPSMRDYFKAIDVDPSEAFGIFKLLDADGSGDVDCEEIVNGLLRLRGNARALELSLLTSETMKIHQTLTKSMEEMERRLLTITRLITKARVSNKDDKDDKDDAKPSIRVTTVTTESTSLPSSMMPMTQPTRSTGGRSQALSMKSLASLGAWAK